MQPMMRQDTKRAELEAEQRTVEARMMKGWSLFLFESCISSFFHFFISYNVFASCCYVAFMSLFAAVLSLV